MKLLTGIAAVLAPFACLACSDVSGGGGTASELPGAIVEAMRDLEREQRSGGPAYAFFKAQGGTWGTNPSHHFAVSFDGAAAHFRFGSLAPSFSMTVFNPRDAGPCQGDERVAGPKIEIPCGSMTTWYLNGPLGLEQGFVLQERLPGDIEVRLEGVRARAEGDEVALVEPSGRVVARYGRLGLDPIWWTG